MSRCFLCIALSLLFSLHGYANGTQVFILGVQAEGDLVQKALEIDKMVCLAGAAVAKKKKQAALCAHELNAMLQHYAMTQSLGIETAAPVRGPEYYLQNALVVFRTFVEEGKDKHGKPIPVLRLQYMKGGTPQPW